MNLPAGACFVFEEAGTWYGAPCTYSLYLKEGPVRALYAKGSTTRLRTNIMAYSVRYQAGQDSHAKKLAITPTSSRGSRRVLRVHFNGRRLNLARVVAFTFGNSPGVSWSEFESTQTKTNPKGDEYEAYVWEAHHTTEPGRQRPDSNSVLAGFIKVKSAAEHVAEHAGQH